MGFAQSRLPWLVAALALILYLVTLNHWLRLDSLPTVARLGGWDESVNLYQPLHYVVTFPAKYLPQRVQPLALNALAAVLAALTLALLARTTALLPFDRTTDERMRQPESDTALLAAPWGWLAPLAAVLGCGLQLSFWEHGTAWTGEMLDLLLFAYVGRCLAEYRVDPKPSWLYRSALVFGVGMTSNFALIAFLPGYVLVVLWLRRMTFFQARFLGVMTGLGLAGMLLYLLLPAVAAATRTDGYSFWRYLQAEFTIQKSGLGAMAPYVALILGLSSLFPLVIRLIRWPDSTGDTNAASAMMTTLTIRFVHLLMLVAAGSVLLDPKWSARVLGAGFGFLPFYYLSALCVGAYVGYYLVVLQFPDRRQRARRHGRSTLLGQSTGPALALAALVLAVTLAVRNYPFIRAIEGSKLKAYADRILQTLPASGGCLISDTPAELAVIEAAMRLEGSTAPHMLIPASMLQRKAYHEAMAKRFGERWPLLKGLSELSEPIDSNLLGAWIAYLSKDGTAFYAHPSMGYFFETVSAQPQGPLFLLRPLPTEVDQAVRLEPASLDKLQAYAQQTLEATRSLPGISVRTHRDLQFLALEWARTFNAWGVALQRERRLKEATPLFARAVSLMPDSTMAPANLEFNALLLRGAIPEMDLNRPLQTRSGQQRWDAVLSQQGPVDHPQWCFRLGQTYAQGSLYRQALTEFRRVREIFPNHPMVRMWEENMAAMAQLLQGNVAAAEQRALALKRQFPKEDVVLETLTQIYLLSGRMPEALASIEEQLRLDPSNQRALLNKAAINIHLKSYEQAIPPLNKVLAAQPENTAALMNRGIANLQSGRLEAAQQDYEALQKLLPNYHAVYFGLGEIALRRNDKPTALRNFEIYLKFGQAGSAEYQLVQQKVQQLKS